MHFSSAAALITLSTLGVTYAAPFANPQEDVVRRKVNYSVVNVDGESTSSDAPKIETVTETIKSVTTAPGIAPLPMTITITATPSTPTRTPTPSSTPHSHGGPPRGASFFPPPNGGFGFLRRGLIAAGDPLQFARGYDSSTAGVTATPLAARGWYSSTSTSSAIALPSLVARQFGGWGPSGSLSATPSSSFTLSPSASALLY